jgi:hypothetical protein
MTEFERLQREIEADERWLRGQGEPAAPAGLARQLKSAIRAALTAERAERWTVQSNRWQGGLAAAAVIALSVLLIRNWNASERVRAERRAAVDQFVATLSVVEVSDPSLTVLRDEIDSVCRASHSSVDAAIDDLSESIETTTGDPTRSM